MTYCIMTNHVHLLLRVPDRKVLADAEMLARLELLCSPAAFAQFMDQWNRMVEQKSEAGLDELRQSVMARMFDISFFMKELKQRFTQWYNRRAKRNGTIWQDRFKSSLIENKRDYLATAAAYIDLNPVRAGMVEDPKDYRFCGYAEALAGGKAAMEGLALLAAMHGNRADEEWILGTHRMILFGKGVKGKEKPGFSPEDVDQVYKQQGALKPWVVAGHRLRWFTDGAVIGSKEYVQELRTRLREKMGFKRPVGAYAAKETADICTLRSLRED